MTLVLNATNHNWKMGKRLGNQAYRKLANERLETVEYKTTRLLEGFLRIHLKGLNTFGISTFPGIESRWGRDFPPVKTGPGTHPASCTMGSGSFSGVKCGRGVLLTTHPLLVPRSWKSRAIQQGITAPQRCTMCYFGLLQSCCRLRSPGM
jgi:hypothetical protein